MSKFSELLRDCLESTRQGLLDVIDAMYLTRLWFQTNGCEQTVTDLIKVAELILNQKKPSVQCPVCKSNKVEIKPGKESHLAGMKCNDCGSHRWLSKDKFNQQQAVGQ